MQNYKVVIQNSNDFRLARKALIQLGYADRTYQHMLGIYWLLIREHNGYWSFTDMYPDRMWDAVPTKTIDELWLQVNKEKGIV